MYGVRAFRGPPLSCPTNGRGRCPSVPVPPVLSQGSPSLLSRLDLSVKVSLNVIPDVPVGQEGAGGGVI